MDKISFLAPVCKKWMNAAFEEVVFWSVTLYLTSNWSIHVAFVGKQLRKHQSKHMHSYRVFKQLLTGWNLKNFKNTALTPCIKKLRYERKVQLQWYYKYMNPNTAFNDCWVSTTSTCSLTPNSKETYFESFQVAPPDL